MRNRVAWRVRAIGGLVVAVIVACAGVLYADAHDDLERARSNAEVLHDRYDKLKDALGTYLEGSVKLREMNDDQLKALQDKICSSDIERDGDEAEQIAKDLVDRVASQVHDAYDHTVDAGQNLFDQLGSLESDLKDLRGQVKDLTDRDEIRDDAGHVLDDLVALDDKITRLFDKLNSDRRTLDNVKNGVMLGMNNPIIRAKVEYGKDKHKELQDSYSCDAREVGLSSGRPDCVKFDQDDCKVIEFKPDSWDEDKARDQANHYVDAVRDYFKDDDRSKRCARQSDGSALYRAVGVLYPRCRS